jgi:hypothetical protein
MPSAPVIATIGLSPNIVATGETVSVALTWLGDTPARVTYQWRDGETLIRGQTAGAYVPNGTEIALNCVVEADSGFGTAIAVALITEITDGEDPEEPSSGSDFSSEFSSEFSGGS